MSAQRIHHLTAHFMLVDGILNKRFIVGPLLRCLKDQEANYVLSKIHKGDCESHIGGQPLVWKALLVGYFWSTLEQNVQ